MALDSRITPARPDLAASSLRGKVEAARFTDGTMMQIASPVVPLHHGPSREAPLDSELLYGERFLVFEDRDGWSWGQSQTDSYVGYVPSVDLGALSFEPTHRVAAPATHVYVQPNVKSQAVARLSMASQLTITGADGAFDEMVSRRRGKAYVPAVHLRAIGSYCDDFVSVAERFLGVPYLWGGRSSLGLDCSALVQLSLAEAGVVAPRDSDLQREALGEETGGGESLSKLARGDLVFWQRHVAIAFDARRIIHANATAMAVSIDYAATFAERVRPAEGPVLTVKRLAAA
jgi:cell wall-associated NlpC family hydrolase